MLISIFKLKLSQRKMMTGGKSNPIFKSEVFVKELFDLFYFCFVKTEQRGRFILNILADVQAIPAWLAACVTNLLSNDWIQNKTTAFPTVAIFRQMGDFSPQAGDHFFAKIASEIWAIFGHLSNLANFE